MYVPGNGPKQAKLVIVGEAPGAEEERCGMPFVGASGRLLDSVLLRAGMRRGLVYATNVIKERPQNNDFSCYYHDKKKKVPTDQLLAAIEALHAEIAEIKPNIVLALGGEALKALTGRVGITKWRGSIISYSPSEDWTCKVIGTFHPAAILRVYEDLFVFKADVRKAIREMGFPEIRWTPPTFVLSPTYETVLEWLNAVPNETPVTLDVETVGEYVRCLGLARSKDEAICIPFTCVSPRSRSLNKLLEPEKGLFNYWPSAEEELAVLRALDSFIRVHPIIVHNYPFDSQMIEKDFGLHITNLEMDTMLASHCCYSESLKGLDFLCSIYSDVPYYSDYNFWDDNQVWIYNGYDCTVTYEVYKALKGELKRLEVDRFYKEHAEPSMLSLARCGCRGVMIDPILREKVRKETEEKRDKHLANVQLRGGPKFNPDSPKQLKTLLYFDMRLTPQYSRSAEGGLTTDEMALKKLLSIHPTQASVIQDILDYRGSSKLINSFLNTKVLPDGRMPTSYNATGTVTGRISSSRTLFGYGGNLQQIPRGSFRKMFVPTPGHIFVKGDLSQAEARAVAWFADIKQLKMNFLKPNFDVHKWNASLIFNIPIELVSSEQRQQAKHCLHSANYMGGPFTAVKHAGIPYAIASRAITAYIKQVPELPRWWDRIEVEMREKGYLRTPMGRLRIFFGRVNDDTIRSAIAFLPQSTVADIVLAAFMELDASLPAEAHLVLTTHDEIVLEVPKDKSDEYASILRSSMERPIKLPNEDVPLVIPAEISVGPNWYDQAKVSV